MEILFPEVVEDENAVASKAGGAETARAADSS
ncbi:hypothetical protein J2X76_001176 [Neorhizobium sp. 2083]|nr:hypothetical protein [Neorhizobium sp. 2083]